MIDLAEQRHFGVLQGSGPCRSLLAQANLWPKLTKRHRTGKRWGQHLPTTIRNAGRARNSMAFRRTPMSCRASTARNCPLLPVFRADCRGAGPLLQRLSRRFGGAIWWPEVVINKRPARVRDPPFSGGIKISDKDRHRRLSCRARPVSASPALLAKSAGHWQLTLQPSDRACRKRRLSGAGRQPQKEQPIQRQRLGQMWTGRHGDGNHGAGSVFARLTVIQPKAIRGGPPARPRISSAGSSLHGAMRFGSLFDGTVVSGAFASVWHRLCRPRAASGIGEEPLGPPQGWQAVGKGRDMGLSPVVLQCGIRQASDNRLISAFSGKDYFGTLGLA